MREFKVYCGVINYTIVLDGRNRVMELRIGNMAAIYHRSNYIDEKILKDAFRYMMITEMGQFEELYQLLKKNDSEMFAHAYSATSEMRDACLKLTEE